MLARRLFAGIGTTWNASSLNAYRYASTLVVADHDNNSLNLATLNAVTAASKFGSKVDILVLGHKFKKVVEEAQKISNVERVVVKEDEKFDHSLAESYANAIVKAQKQFGYSHLVAPATSTGKNIMPRVAAILDVAQISEVIEIKSEDTFVRPIYAGNALVTLKSKDKVKVLTVRSTNFEPAGLTNSGATVAELEGAVEENKLSSFVSASIAKSDRPKLESAKIVVSGGRGMKSGDNFKMLYELADKLNGAVGASRAAVDAGFVPNDLQVGQTGKVVAPDLYIAVGISGAIQHLAGMKDSKMIVAINKDADAPIFQISDIGLVDDLFKVIPELNNKIKK